MPPEEPSVTAVLLGLVQSVRDDQQSGFARLEAKLETKADKADVESVRVEMRSEVRHLEARVEANETWRHQREAELVAVNELQNRRTGIVQFRWNLGMVAVMAVLTAGLVAVGIFH